MKNKLLYLIPVMLSAVALVVALKTKTKEDDLPAVANLLDASASAADAAALDAPKQQCIALTVAAASASSAAESVRAAADGECLIPSVSVDVSRCLGREPAEGVDVPAVVEAAAMPTLDALGSAASLAKSARARAWIRGAIDFVRGGFKPTVAFIESPDMALVVPGASCK